MNESCNSCEKRLTCNRYAAMSEEGGDMGCSKYSAEQKPKEHILKMAEASAQSRRDSALNDDGYQNAKKVARDMRERGATLKEICATLNSLEGMTPRRNGKWATGQISRMLGNTVN